MPKGLFKRPAIDQMHLPLIQVPLSVVPKLV